MKENILACALILLSFFSCESPKSEDLKQAVMDKERIAFKILLDKNGSETKKQECLVKNDYQCALAAVDTQKIEFDDIVKDLEGVSVTGVKEGELLRNAAVNYYKALQELHLFDRKEIELQSLISRVPKGNVKEGRDELIVLASQKKILYRKVYEQEHLLGEALKKFHNTNGL